MGLTLHGENPHDAESWKADRHKVRAYVMQKLGITEDDIPKNDEERSNYFYSLIKGEKLNVAKAIFQKLDFEFNDDVNLISKKVEDMMIL